MHKYTIFICIMNAPSVLERRNHREILFVRTNVKCTYIMATFEMRTYRDDAM